MSRILTMRVPQPPRIFHHRKRHRFSYYCVAYLPSSLSCSSTSSSSSSSSSPSTRLLWPCAQSSVRARCFSTRSSASPTNSYSSSSSPSSPYSTSSSSNPSSSTPSSTSTPLSNDLPIVDLPIASSSSSAQHTRPSKEPANSMPSRSNAQALRFVLAFAFATGSLFFFQYLTGSSSSSTPSSTSSSTPSPSASLKFASNDRKSNTSQSSAVSTSPAASSIADLIGNTPLLEIKSLSLGTGRKIYGKMEGMNPGGSVKDRAAKAIMEDLVAKRQKDLAASPASASSSRPLLIEASGGNTAIALAMLAPVYGFDCLFVYPESISPDKIRLMAALGAKAVAAPLVPFSSPEHFYHKSHTLAKLMPDSYHTDQFENAANFRAHFTTTGPEIEAQLLRLQAKVDGFVCASGTGGTLAGVSAYLKTKNPNLCAALIDPPGSGLYHFLHEGQWTGRSKPGDWSVVEGIGIFRLTGNMASAQLDRAFAGDEREAVEIAHHVRYHDGLFIGPSAALNLAGAVKLARQLPEGSTVVTIVCDSGAYYTGKLFNPQWLQEKGLAHVLQQPQHAIDDLSFIADGDSRPLHLVPAVEQEMQRKSFATRAS